MISAKEARYMVNTFLDRAQQLARYKEVIKTWTNWLSEKIISYSQSGTNELSFYPHLMPSAKDMELFLHSLTNDTISCLRDHGYAVSESKTNSNGELFYVITW